MYQAIKAAVKSNNAVDLLKDDGLYNAVRNLKTTSAKQSELSTIDKAMRNATSSKEYNEALAQNASTLSNRITRTGTDSMKGRALSERLSTVEQAQAGAKGLSESAFKAKREVVQSGAYKKLRNKEISDELAPLSKKAMSAGKSYFVDGNNSQRLARAGAAAGALGTVAVGGRYLSGGSVTTNNRGERDIAGIPFV